MQQERTRNFRSKLWAAILVCVLLVLVSGPAFAAPERTHVVKRGETLYGLARRYKISRSDLAEYNGIKPSSWLMIGQKLKIPATNGSAVRPPKLPSSVQKAINAAKVKRGRWKKIIVHHSGTEEGTAKGMNEYHLHVRHMEHGLAYHFVIGNGHGMKNGEIYVGNRWKQQLNGGHLASEKQNTYCLGICLVGNFEKDVPTTKQMQSLEALILALEKRCQLTPEDVMTHKQINVIDTACPGKHFPTDKLLKDLRALSPR